MTMNTTFARRLRLDRIDRGSNGRLLIVPLDHSVSSGPYVRSGQLDRLVGRIACNGADAVVLHKGAIRHVSTCWFRSMSLIVHLSAGTVRSPDPDDRYLVAGVDEALRLGADAVSVHVNLGSTSDRRQVADLAAVAASCERWSVPLLAMVYPRGPAVSVTEPGAVAHAAVLAADLGADLVKTAYPGSVEAMSDVTSRCPIPLLVAGGPVGGDTERVICQIGDALRGGAAGAAVGRLVIDAADPAAMTSRLATLIHDRHESDREYEREAVLVGSHDGRRREGGRSPGRDTPRS
jgi:2-amino-4,5-dihydroxy-6-oxo-7-(phosphonooxy)heptanoate synthase